jgi:hypothetical protein
MRVCYPSEEPPNRVSIIEVDYRTAVGYRQRERRASREDCWWLPARAGRLVVGRTRESRKQKDENGKGSSSFQLLAFLFLLSLRPAGFGRSAAPLQALTRRRARWGGMGGRVGSGGGHRNVDRCRVPGVVVVATGKGRRRTIAPQGSPV